MTETEIMELRQAAAEKTGVPVDLITGETVKEIATSAFELAKFKAEQNNSDDENTTYEGMTTQDQFALWLDGEAPAEPEADSTPAAPKYPIVSDGGDPQSTNYARTAREVFLEWFGIVL